MNDAMRCGECGQLVRPAGAFHPFLYCELYKLGHANQAQYLASYGFERVPVGARRVRDENEQTK